MTDKPPKEPEDDYDSEDGPYSVGLKRNRAVLSLEEEEEEKLEDLRGEMFSEMERWAKTNFDNTPVGALMYLKHRMFKLRDLPPMEDKALLVRKAKMYWEYRNQVVMQSKEELALLG